jgi:hypothetical protein
VFDNRTDVRIANTVTIGAWRDDGKPSAGATVLGDRVGFKISGEGKRPLARTD